MKTNFDFLQSTPDFASFSSAAIAADIKEIYTEAKSAGFDPKYIRQMIRLRKMDPDELDETDELTQMYRNALGL